MDFKIACETLELKAPFTEKTLKNAYYKKALFYHPDKNKDPEADNVFKQVVSANEYLQTYLKVDREIIDEEEKVYDSMFEKFFNTIFEDKTLSTVFIALCGYIKAECSESALKIIKKLDEKSKIEIIDYMSSYKDILGISDEIIEKFKQKAITKYSHQIILNPTLNNIINQDVYCLDVSGETIYVPLWHEEITYDISCGTIIIVNKLNLPDNIAIDHNNDLHVHIRYSLVTAFSNETISITLGEKVFDFSIKDLFLRKQQITRLIGVGVPRINQKNIMDISEIGDIIIHLELY